MSLDQDTRVQSYLGMKQEMNQLSAAFGAQASFIEPEILKMDPANSPGVHSTREEARNLQALPGRHPAPESAYGHRRRGKDHCGCRTDVDAASSIHGIFSNADFPYPEVTLRTAKVKAGFIRICAAANQCKPGGPEKRSLPRLWAG